MRHFAAVLVVAFLACLAFVNTGPPAGAFDHACSISKATAAAATYPSFVLLANASTSAQTGDDFAGVLTRTDELRLTKGESAQEVAATSAHRVAGLRQFHLDTLATNRFERVVAYIGDRWALA